MDDQIINRDSDLDLLYDAWTVIANAENWFTDPGGEWVTVAIKWREQFHTRLRMATGASL